MTISPAVQDMLTLLAAMAAGAVFMLALSFIWGRFMGRTALRTNASKWKAYVAAVFPMAALAVTLLNSDLAPMAGDTFLALSSPALLGAFWRYHWGGREFPEYAVYE
jgi:formate/nitrite transporter FocA (FNT family)